MTTPAQKPVRLHPRDRDRDAKANPDLEPLPDESDDNNLDDAGALTSLRL